MKNILEISVAFSILQLRITIWICFHQRTRQNIKILFLTQVNNFKYSPWKCFFRKNISLSYPSKNLNIFLSIRHSSRRFQMFLKKFQIFSNMQSSFLLETSFAVSHVLSYVIYIAKGYSWLYIEKWLNLSWEKSY